MRSARHPTMSDDLPSLPSLARPYSVPICATFVPTESEGDDSSSCPVVVTTGATTISDVAAAPEGDNVDKPLGPFEAPSEMDVTFREVFCSVHERSSNARVAPGSVDMSPLIVARQQHIGCCSQRSETDDGTTIAVHHPRIVDVG
jgi:hypothetical protein